MKVKINEKILCISPFLSTTWDQVVSLECEGEDKEKVVVIHLKDGTCARIPKLEESIIDLIFSAHVKYLESTPTEGEKIEEKSPMAFLQQLFGQLPEQLSSLQIFPLSGGGMPEGIEGAFQHDLSKADTADLPPEVLDQIVNVATSMTQGDLSEFPKPEPHCNCMHCQLARAVHKMPPDAEVEETVSDEELTFRTWDIEQIDEKLYKVIHPIDKDETYQVYLGSPVGCTCGEKDCEHIKAVLSS